MSTTINKKINHIFLILEKLAKGDELYSQNIDLQDELDVDKRTLDRYLEDIHSLYGHIVLVDKKKTEHSERRVTVYRVTNPTKDIAEAFKFFIENSDDFGWLMQLVLENDPSIVKNFHDRKAIEESLKKESDIFLFKQHPFELFSDNQQKIFKELKVAVKNREYRSFNYDYKGEMVIDSAKCLKIVFMSNNWYLAIENQKQAFQFLRIAFIKQIKYSKSKTSFHSKVLEKYEEYFDSLQNPMTLHKKPKQALLLASKKVAIYFKKNMKPFFPTQEFIKENIDGSVEFKLSFTQPIEILPFIKQWQPDLKIIAPDSLQKELIQDLQKAVNNYS